MTEYYSIISKTYDELYQEEQLNKLNLIKKHFQPKPLLLDIGAGTGISTKFFKIDAIALDPSKGMLKKYNGKKIVGKSELLPFPNNTFNSIIAITSLHHTKDINKTISEIKRVSKKECQYAFTILKKAKIFHELKEKLLNNFNLKEIDEKKDLILISQKNSKKDSHLL